MHLELNKIYNIDAIHEGFKMIPDNSIDLIITDPPYKTISGGSNNGKNHKRPQGILNNNKKLFKHQDLEISDWISELYRILKEETHCYIFTNVLNMEKMLTESQKAGFKLHNILVWLKNNCTPSQYYMKNCEYVLFLRKGKAKWINDIGGSKTGHEFLIENDIKDDIEYNPVAIQIDNIIGNKIHPTEKPVELIKFYINNSSNKGDLVLDPFMGSGSLAEACIQTDRNFIGFEIDEEYYNVCQNRLKLLK